MPDDGVTDLHMIHWLTGKRLREQHEPGTPYLQDRFESGSDRVQLLAVEWLWS